MGLVDGRVLITGASGGLGQAMARAFAQRGATLVLSGRRADVLSALADELGALALAADLGDPAAVQRLAEQAGAVDVLIANAALPATGRLTELSQAQIDTMLTVNLRAPIALTRALTPGMVARGRGHVVLISSLAGKAASPASSLYNATKFGLRGFAHAARADLADAGVGVSVVLPGFIRDAGMFADAGVRLPPLVATRTPAQVAEAVFTAIERNRAEVTVAPLGLRLGADIASVAPGLSARVQRLAGGRRIARQLAARQAQKRP
ncbi:MAG: SDR family NAD(P)-dependent oxidoreductase [Solirubrobacteraceae bacterium]